MSDFREKCEKLRGVCPDCGTVCEPLKIYEKVDSGYRMDGVIRLLMFIFFSTPMKYKKSVGGIKTNIRGQNFEN